MGQTYIQLTNRLLRRIKEVELSSSDFSTARGVQALAQDAIKSAVAEINRAEFEWPFNATEHTDTLTIGTSEYAWPLTFKTVDFESFQIQGDDSLNAGYTTLKPIDRDIWYRRFRDRDYEAGSSGLSIPKYVFMSHGVGYGVTPVPDKAYSIKFRYYQTNVDLVNGPDETRIPEEHSDVIVDGALYYMFLQRDNVESAQLVREKFLTGVRNMQNVYLPRTERVYDTRLPHPPTVGRYLGTRVFRA